MSISSVVDVAEALCIFRRAAQPGLRSGARTIAASSQEGVGGWASRKLIGECQYAT